MCDGNWGVAELFLFSGSEITNILHVIADTIVRYVMVKQSVRDLYVMVKQSVQDLYLLVNLRAHRARRFTRRQRLRTYCLTDLNDAIVF